MNTWQVHKESVHKKHQVKAAYFKLIHLWKCSQNQWRHCKIISFCMNAPDVWCPCNMQQYISTDKFIGTELKYVWSFIIFTKKRWWLPYYVVMTNFQLEISFREPFNKSSSCIRLFYGPCLHAPLKQDQSHFTTLCFNLYRHQ